MRQLLSYLLIRQRCVPKAVLPKAKTRVNLVSASLLFGLLTPTEATFPPSFPRANPQYTDLQLRSDDRNPVDDVKNFSWRDAPQLLEKAIRDLREASATIWERKIESEGGRATVAITAINIAVYTLWKTAPSGFMIKHFTNSLESVRKARVWTTVTANFSHMGVFHLASNMYMLNRFGHDVADILGSERFFVFYGASGIASSLASLTFRRMTKSNIISLGASGAVVSTLWLYACLFPDRRMSIIGLERTFTIQELVLTYSMIDAAGLLGSSVRIDFAAHLGGALFGNVWFHAVRDKLIEEQTMENLKERRRAWKALFGARKPVEGNGTDTN